MLIIQPADLGHIPAIRDIYNDAVNNSTAVWTSIPSTLQERTAWWHSRQNSNFPVLVARIDQQILGYASYGAFRASDGYRHTAELSIYIRSEERSKGIGSALMRALIDEARYNEIHVLIGAVEAQNTASLRLHEAFGFTQSGYLPQVGYKFDRWLDLILMQLIL